MENNNLSNGKSGKTDNRQEEIQKILAEIYQKKQDSVKNVAKKNTTLSGEELQQFIEMKKAFTQLLKECNLLFPKKSYEGIMSRKLSKQLLYNQLKINDIFECIKLAIALEKQKEKNKIINKEER